MEIAFIQDHVPVQQTGRTTSSSLKTLGAVAGVEVACLGAQMPSSEEDVSVSY